MNNNFWWLFSIFLIGIVSIVFFVFQIFNIEISDNLIRILGVVDLVAMPVLAFTTVRKMKNTGKEKTVKTDDKNGRI